MSARINLADNSIDALSLFKMTIPSRVSQVSAFSLLFVGIALCQSSQPEKLQALKSPVCVLPYGQTIDFGDLPPHELALNWQGRLKGDLPVSLVSIPSTHDAGTALGRTGWTRCQVLTLPAQLGLGVRGFDVRLRVVGDELKVYHSEESQKLTFESVMSSFNEFLKAHPKEFLVMRVREEAKALQSSLTFEAAFQMFYDSPKYSKLFYRAKSRTEIPTVQQVRGRIVLLDNYGKLPNAIEYPNSSMSVQDDYDTSDMDQKFREIQAKFEDALAQKSGEVWNVNYTSSSTPQVDQLQNAMAVNAKVEQYLAHRKGHLGLVLFNFPSAAMIRWVWQSNFR